MSTHVIIIIIVGLSLTWMAYVLYRLTEDGLRSMFTSPVGDEDEEEEEDKEKLIGSTTEPKGKTCLLPPYQSLVTLLVFPPDR